MEDPQRQPKDSDRSLVAGRIKRASDEGRISGADRDIRLGNVWNARSMAELDLMTRELDQLDATPLPTTTTAAGEKPWSKFSPAACEDDDDVSDTVASAKTSPGPAPSSASRAALVSIVVGIAVLAAAVALFLYSRGGDDVALSPGVDPAGEPAGGPASAYALTEPGLRSFLQAYAKRFGTAEVVDLTLYADYAIVNVPVPGKAREAGWIYRPRSGFTSFGPVHAVFSGTQTIDSTQLDVPALVRNLAQARATLKVEEPAQSYVVLRSISHVGDAPQVYVYLTNKFSESGYLMTTLDGTVQKAYPFGQ